MTMTTSGCIVPFENVCKGDHPLAAECRFYDWLPRSHVALLRITYMTNSFRESAEADENSRRRGGRPRAKWMDVREDTYQIYGSAHYFAMTRSPQFLSLLRRYGAVNTLSSVHKAPAWSPSLKTLFVCSLSSPFSLSLSCSLALFHATSPSHYRDY